MLAASTQLAQVLGEGRGDWSWLLYVLIIIVFPVVNKIKDKFVQRAEEQKAEADGGLGSVGPRPMRRVEPKHETARPLGGVRTRSAPPRPAQLVQPAPARAQPAAPPAVRRPQPKARPPMPAPHPAQPDRARPEQVAPPPAGPVARARPAQSARTKSPAKRSAVAGVNVHSADPRVDLRSAEPKIRLRQPTVDIRAADPTVDVRETARTGPDGLLEAGLEGFVGQVTPQELRRVVVLSEIFRPPLALRGEQSSGGWSG